MKGIHCFTAVTLVLVLASGFTLGVLTGCTKDQARENAEKIAKVAEDNIGPLVTASVTLGLHECAKKDAAAAKTAAEQIAKGVEDVLLPYFSGAELPLGTAAMYTLNDLGTKLSKEARIAIGVGVTAIQAFCQIPAAGEYMTARQVANVKVGLKALRDACRKFASAP